VKKCVAKVRSAQLVKIVNLLGILPFGHLHRRFAFAFSIFRFCNFRAWHSGTLGETLDLPCSFLLNSFLALFLNPNTGNSTIYIIQQFNRDVSNSATQDSIMNGHKKTQLTHARINCALKDSSCDSPLIKNLKLTLLASNAGSSSTKVIKWPHIKNDSIFTHTGSII
ncbi:hypothetical protein H5410_045652, partial [Solanum commersonii]